MLRPSLCIERSFLVPTLGSDDVVTTDRLRLVVLDLVTRIKDGYEAILWLAAGLTSFIVVHA